MLYIFIQSHKIRQKKLLQIYKLKNYCLNNNTMN